jgi:hypothetical protein
VWVSRSVSADQRPRRSQLLRAINSVTLNLMPLLRRRSAVFANKHRDSMPSTPVHHLLTRLGPSWSSAGPHRCIAICCSTCTKSCNKPCCCSQDPASWENLQQPGNLGECRLQVYFNMLVQHKSISPNLQEHFRPTQHRKLCRKEGCACTARDGVVVKLAHKSTHKSTVGVQCDISYSPSLLPMTHAFHSNTETDTVRAATSFPYTMQRCCLSTCNCIPPVQQHQAGCQ